jgi:hypothetical protein
VSDERSDAPVIGYMCLTDYWHELGETEKPGQVYSSIGDLRDARPCVATCGIAEVEVRLRRIVQDPDQ